MLTQAHPAQFVLASDENLGAIEITTFLSLILLGVSLSQGYTFFLRSGKDRVSLKFLVSFLLLLELFHSFTASHAIYYDTVTRWERGEANSYPLSINVLTENLITFMVQCFFCHRVSMVSRKLPLSIICVVMSVLRFIGGIALSVESLLDVPRTPNGNFVFTFSWLITSALAVGAATDVIIAVSLVFYLRKMTSPSNLKSTTAFLNRLVRWTLQTGLLTSMTSVTVIICFQAMSNMVWFGVYVILAKLYSISLLVSLNARYRSGKNHGSEDLRQTHLEFQVPAPISGSFQPTHDGDVSLWSPALVSKAYEV